MTLNNANTPSDPIKDVVTEARRTQILDAAVQVFAEKGFHRATIKDVAKAAGVADGTIYNYFESKQDLMVAMVAQLAEIGQLIGQITQQAEFVPPEQLLRGIFTNRIELVTRNRAKIQAILPQVITDEALRTLFYETLLAPNLAIIETIWQKKIDQGQVRPLDPHLLVQAIFGMFMGMTILDLIGNSTFSGHQAEVIDAAVTILLHGISSTDDQAKTTAGGA